MKNVGTFSNVNCLINEMLPPNSKFIILNYPRAMPWAR